MPRRRRDQSQHADEIIETAQRRDTFLRAYAYAVLSLIPIVVGTVLALQLAAFNRDHKLIANSEGERQHLLAIEANTNRTLHDLEGAINAGASSSSDTQQVVTDLEDELRAICSAVRCRGITFTRPNYTGSTSTTTARRSPGTTSTSTSTTTTTTTRPPGTTTTTRCTRVPTDGCLPVG